MEYRTLTTLAIVLGAAASVVAVVNYFDDKKDKELKRKQLNLDIEVKELQLAQGKKSI